MDIIQFIVDDLFEYAAIAIVSGIVLLRLINRIRMRRLLGKDYRCEPAEFQTTSKGVRIYMIFMLMLSLVVVVVGGYRGVSIIPAMSHIIVLSLFVYLNNNSLKFMSRLIIIYYSPKGMIVRRRLLRTFSLYPFISTEDIDYVRWSDRIKSEKVRGIIVRKSGKRPILIKSYRNKLDEYNSFFRAMGIEVVANDES